MILAPEINRIVFFGRPGGVNALWLNEGAASKRVGGWVNWGGEKIWFWPQADWPRRTGKKAWPPPMDGFPGRADDVNGSLRYVLSGLAAYPGIRVVRTISLASSGCVEVTTEVLDESGRATFRPWSVLQIECPLEILVGNQAVGGRFQWMEGDQGTPLLAVHGGWSIRPPPKKMAKYGFDAATLSARTPAGILEVCSDAQREDSLTQDAAQVYFEATGNGKRPSGLPRYAELEFAAPAGSSVLRQYWTLA